MLDEIILPTSEAPKKIENFLKKRFPIGYVRKLFRRNGIRLNGKHPGPADIVYPGDRIQLYIPYQEAETKFNARKSWETKIKVIFEDNELLVLDKPAGVAVHEGKEILKRHSVLGILQAKYHASGIVPRLVHRLDKDTSGVLLAAKQQKLAQELENSFQAAKVDKEYLCLVVGRLAQSDGKIDLPLPGRHGNLVRAVSRYEIANKYSDTTLLRVRIATGRMHQIRLHLAKLGHPLVMDDQYGDFAFNKRFRKDYGLKRQFLHAAKLALEYRGQKRTWQAPLPRDLAETLRLLEQSSRHGVLE